MARNVPETKIVASGLRYESKKAGSPFAPTKTFGSAIMSCFLCGNHRPRAQLTTRRLMGNNQVVCAPSCKELAANLATPPTHGDDLPAT